jgi:hypothetical protein
VDCTYLEQHPWPLSCRSGGCCHGVPVSLWCCVGVRGMGWAGKYHTQRLCFKLDVIHKHSKQINHIHAITTTASLSSSWWCGCLVLLPVSWSFIRTLCLFLPSASKHRNKPKCMAPSTGTSTKVARPARLHRPARHGCVEECVSVAVAAAATFSPCCPVRPHIRLETTLGTRFLCLSHPTSPMAHTKGFI